MSHLGWCNHKYRNYSRVWVLNTPEAIRVGATLCPPESPRKAGSSEAEENNSRRVAALAL